ncbi:hypothetical protein FA04_03945 [Ensifer adhaerens]|nr:hypothetical protein FA04_03945 [Ensifer adhaerens]KDP71131.1 hypothetical protein FA04_25705 [Ensifer adhaerens]KQX04100.1 hypothetical protein ASD01_14260 [Ensifer sp. Root423]KQZ45659.1 hypothetical protein ASD63_11000 [Ensifer sp. Root558]
MSNRFNSPTSAAKNARADPVAPFPIANFAGDMAIIGIATTATIIAAGITATGTIGIDIAATMTTTTTTSGR